MPNVHKCTLPQSSTFGLPKLPPNASFCKRLLRKLRKLIIVNPNHYKCYALAFNKSAIKSEQRRHIMGPHKYMIHPFSTLCTVQEILFFVLWTTRMWFEPIVDTMLEVDSATFTIVECIIVFLKSMVIISFFFLGYVDKKTKEVVIDTKRVICRYLKTFFVFDLISTEIPYVIAGWTLVKDQEYWFMYKVPSFMHLPCLYVRLNTILNYLDDIVRLMKLGKKTRKAVVHALRTYMWLHFFACMLYLIPRLVYGKIWPTDSWLAVAKIDPGKGALFRQIYGECLLMTICSFFGASEKFPVYQTNEQITFTIVSFFGRLYTLFLIADILRVFGIAGQSESNYERELAQMKEYIRSNDFPLSMRSKMIRYFEYKFQKRFFDEVEIVNSLSGYLRTQIFLFFASTIMEKCIVFKYLPHTEVATMFSLMRLETFTPGDFIYKAGQLIQHIYFISSGSVAIISKDGIELCHLEDGDVFGLCTVLLGKEIHSALVLEATDILLIETDKFYECLEKYPDIMEHLHKTAKEKLTFFREQEHIFKKEKSGCLHDVRNGRLLEKRRERAIIQ